MCIFHSHRGGEAAQEIPARALTKRRTLPGLAMRLGHPGARHSISASRVQLYPSIHLLRGNVSWCERVTESCNNVQGCWAQLCAPGITSARTVLVRLHHAVYHVRRDGLCHAHDRQRGDHRDMDDGWHLRAIGTQNVRSALPRGLIKSNDSTGECRSQFLRQGLKAKQSMQRQCNVRVCSCQPQRGHPGARERISSAAPRRIYDHCRPPDNERDDAEGCDGLRTYPG